MQILATSLDLMTTKAVSFSYPSSPNALRFGHKAGCFVVELSYMDKPPVALCGFSTLAEALSHAEGLAFPWSVWTVQNEATLLSTAGASLIPQN